MTETGNSGAINRSDGLTPAERYLKQLCEGTFLSLWSYPGLYRDQRSRGEADGKEIADLIVVFENHIIVFSDKHCAVPASGDIRKDWSRWFRRAVVRSAEQAWGAERWLRSFPNRVFLDRECNRPFPLPVPNVAEARFHLVVVAHEIAARDANELGGSGSLMVRNDMVGVEAHTEPFVVGDLYPKRSFVHVFDDTSLEIVMRTLDTIADFTAYLDKKEKLFRSKSRVFAAGEEELLALYLTRMNPNGEHDFDLPSDADVTFVDEGHWERFQKNPQRLAQIAANEISYSWDRLIEKFNYHALKGTQYFVSPGGVQTTERIVRFMAREPRVRRRMLATALNGLIHKTKPEARASRVVLPSRPGEPFYVFLLLPLPADLAYEEYRTGRQNLLQMYCHVVKLRFPDAEDIIGIATESGFIKTRSEDAVYLDARAWTPELQDQAEKLQSEFSILVNTVEFRGTEKEYPDVVRQSSERPAISVGRNPRNKPCPCGSGKKYKKCHGR